MSTANPTTTDGPFDSSHTQHHRRSREEVEALAKNFVATPVEAAPLAAKPTAKIAMAAAGGVVLLAIVAIVAWPTKDKAEETARPAAQAEAARVAAEAEQWKQRFEAERERKRKELASSKEYLERIAAADAALVGEIAERASKLSERAAAAPASSDSVPTPREAPAKASTAPAKPAVAPSTTATASAAPAPKPAAPAPTTEVAKAAPAEAAPATQEAAKSSCAIHVSELSASGKLTYDAVMKMKGARLDEETGHVFTPQVKGAGGRTVQFEVMPDGCVRVVKRLHQQ